MFEKEGGVESGKPITRREFLKLTGRLGTMLGLGAGLGGAVGSCGDGRGVSSTIATIAGASTTTQTTAVADTGREIRIGVVSAKSGPLALFGRADDWWMEYAGIACPEGVLCADRKLHRLLFAVEDSCSLPETAAQAADELISNAAVDMITCSGSTSVVNAVADRAEELGCPCLSSFHEWRPFVFRGGEYPEAPFKWTYAHAIGLEDIAANYAAIWEQVVTNKKVGVVATENDESLAWAHPSTGVLSAAETFGYEVLLSSLGRAGTDDYVEQIGELSRNGCEICCTLLSAEDLLTFWRQTLQSDYRPKIVTAGLALRFPQTLEAMGSGAGDFTAESLWQPDWPYEDSITGNSAAELAEDYMTRTGEQWIAPLAQYAKFEWAIDIFKRVTDLDDKDSVIERVRTTKLDTCLGRIDFTAPVDANARGMGIRPSENVCKAPVTAAQWIGGGALKFRPLTVANTGWPTIPATNTVQPMTYE